MWNPAGSTRRALQLSMAAAVAFLGCAVMLKAGRAMPPTTGAPTADVQGFLLLAIVILLAATGALLLVMAGRELFGGGPRPHHPL